jgi:hypothetical protein
MSTATQKMSSEIDDLPIEGFYLPSESLTVRIADRIESLESEAIRSMRFKEESDVPETESDDSLYLRNISAPTSSDTSAQVLFQQRLLAEELDSCLADSAESAEAISGQKLNIQKIVTEGMSDALGLAVSDGLLSELSVEFQNWIDDLGSFTAAWGEIISTNDGYMHLAAFEDSEEELAIKPAPTFTRIYPSTKAETPKNIFARVAAKLGVG